MMSNIKISIDNNIILLAGGNLLRVLLVIVYSRMQTFFLDYEELSKFYLVFSLYTFFSFIIIGSIGSYINRKTIEWLNNNTLKSALHQLFYKFLLPLSFIAFVTVFIYTFYMYNSVSYSLIICSLISGLLVIKTSNETIYPIFNIINKNKKYLFFLLLFNILNIGFSIFFVSYFEAKFQFWMTGLITSNFLVAFLAYSILKKEFQNSLKIKINIKELTSFSTSILVGHILIWFLTDGFRFIAENKIDSYNLGILLLGLMTATQIFSLIENFLIQVLYPKYLNNISNKNYTKRADAFNKYFNIIFPLVLSISIFTTLVADEILFILVDESKINTSLINVFKIGIWIEFIRLTINLLKNITMSEYKTKKIILPYLTGCLIFLFIIYLNNTSDLLYISLLLFVSYFIILILSIFSFNRIIKIKLNYYQIIVILLFITPAFLILLYMKNTLTIVFSTIYLLIVFFYLLNKNYLTNEIN